MFASTILRSAFVELVRHGTLEVETSRGPRFKIGDGAAPRVAIRFTDPGAERALCLDPELKLGELYMDGRLRVEHGTIYDLLQLLLQDSRGDLGEAPLHFVRRVLAAARSVRRVNDAVRSRRNIAHHYDLDARLYDLFLDSDRQYSCAYFETADATLDAAQVAKKRHIMAKLLVEPGQSVLDIGSGWGGLALSLVEEAGAGQVKGITLSEEQLAVSRRRAVEHGLADRASFALEDYRAVRGSFDRIVSVGMFEHVGVRAYDTFFRTCRRLLNEDGVMLLHTIGRTGRPYPTNPWIRRYIFPGGHLPTLSAIAPAIERSGLIVTA